MKLVVGIHYYIENGKFVFTEKFLKDRGYCCKSGCRHCPYGFQKGKENVEPRVSDRPVRTQGIS